MSSVGRQLFLLPLLRALSDGKPRRIAELHQQLAATDRRSGEEEPQAPAWREQLRRRNRARLSRTYLERAGLIETLEPGSIRITQAGLDLLVDPPDELNYQYLKRYPEFLEYDNARVESTRATAALNHLVNQVPGCGQLHCSTCGGLAGYWSEIHSFIERYGPLAPHLAKLRSRDLREQGRECGTIGILLDHVPPEDLPTLLSAWQEQFGRDPDLGLAVVRNAAGSWATHAPASFWSAAVDVLEPQILATRELRERILNVAPLELRGRLRLFAAVAEDQRLDREAAEREQMARERVLAEREAERRRRTDFLDMIERLPAADRLERVGDAVVIYAGRGRTRGPEQLAPDDLRPEWARLSDEELDEIPRNKVERILTSFPETNVDGWDELRVRLQDRAYRLRGDAMDAHRARLAGIPAIEQLRRLLADPSIPLEDYPSELAAAVDRDLLRALDPDTSERFLRGLARTWLRRWQRVYTRAGGSR